MTENLNENKEFLESKKTAADLLNLYKNDPRQKTFNLLLLGEMGTGKTFLARTARKPILFHSFDPGGTKSVRDLIETGDIIADTRYESENPMRPTMFPIWQKEMDRLDKEGVFKHFGTFIIDSSTSWAEMIMNDILKKAGIPGQAPRFTHDYTPQKTLIRNFIRQCLDLPCDFILTGHLAMHTDEVSKRISYRYATTGQGTVTIPTLFDEVWVMDPKTGSNGTTYRILTQSTGTHACRSRLSSTGKLEQYEEPNIKNILKKVGLEYNDKPKLV